MKDLMGPQYTYKTCVMTHFRIQVEFQLVTGLFMK